MPAALSAEPIEIGTIEDFDRVFATLGAQRRSFVFEYMKDLNASSAARRCVARREGRGQKTAPQYVARYIYRPDVRACIGFLIRQQAEETKITREMIVDELKKVAFANASDVVRWRSGVEVIKGVDAEGEVEFDTINIVEVMDSDDLDPDVLAAVSEVSKGKDGAIRIKLHNKLQALDLLGKFLGMWQEGANVNVTLPSTGKAADDRTLALAVIAQLSAGANQQNRKVIDGDASREG